MRERKAGNEWIREMERKVRKRGREIPVHCGWVGKEFCYIPVMVLISCYSFILGLPFKINANHGSEKGTYYAYEIRIIYERFQV